MARTAPKKPTPSTMRAASSNHSPVAPAPIRLPSAIVAMPPTNVRRTPRRRTTTPAPRPRKAPSVAKVATINPAMSRPIASSLRISGIVMMALPTCAAGDDAAADQQRDVKPVRSHAARSRWGPSSWLASARSATRLAPGHAGNYPISRSGDRANHDRQVRRARARPERSWPPLRFHGRWRCSLLVQRQPGDRERISISDRAR